MEWKGTIKYDDNFLNENESMKVLDYCHNCPYTYGETDDDNLPPTGMISEIEGGNEIYHLFEKRLNDKSAFLQNMTLYRMYINCFVPNENPYFHVDGEGITFLYYASEYWDLNDGGETQFYLDGNILGVPPVPNRLVMFDGMIQHRATSFRTRHRFTVAIKYVPQ